MGAAKVTILHYFILVVCPLVSVSFIICCTSAPRRGAREQSSLISGSGVSRFLAK